ncbi:MAG: hypothetical protein O2816_16670 [Planctomycetota bacterium]|nr:hypothetical protein [Planctomycetota bacterium]
MLAAIPRAFTQEPEVTKPGPSANPMASFASMVLGEWEVKFISGKSMFNRWLWGPGKHSVRVMTDGLAGAGEPWRAVRAFYWHPGRKEVRFLGVSPFARGIEEGSMKLEEDSADARYDLHQVGHRRQMGLRWDFDGPDKYHEDMLEAVGSLGLKSFNKLDYARIPARGPVEPDSAEALLRPSKFLRALSPLLGRALESTGEGARPLQSTVTWIPYADAIYVRLEAPSEAGQPTHLMDAYIYHHTGAGALRCLALTGAGGVYEGDVSVLEGGALQCDLTGYVGDQVHSHVVRLDFAQDGTLRDRIWTLDKNGERTLLRDVAHSRVEAKQD